MNLFESLEKASEELRDSEDLDHIFVDMKITQDIESIKSGYRYDFQQDRDTSDPKYLTDEQIDEVSLMYACVDIFVDFDEFSDYSDNEFITVDFDYGEFEKAFKEVLLKYLDKDKFIIPKEINFNGHNEFFHVDYKNKYGYLWR